MTSRTANPKVLLVSLGGTIAMTRSHTDGAARPTLGVSDLVAAVPQLSDTDVTIATLPASVAPVPGASLSLDAIEALAVQLGTMEKEGSIDGAVVMQGTDTLEESAFLMSLIYSGRAPVVVTGAMRAPHLAGADGPANLLAAVSVAGSSAARGLGVLVAFNDQVFDPARVRKAHSTSTAAFTAPDTGPLGVVAEGKFRLLATPAHTPAPITGTATNRVHVGLYTASLGDDGSHLPHLLSHADGMVIAGFGVGHVPERWVPALHEAAQRIPVILASRTGGGTTLSSTYGFSGSEKDLLNGGLIGAGHLDPYKARLLLLTLLQRGADRDRIRRAFAPAGTAPEGRG
ncbi:asparaginase [Streptomyces aureocirculatus]|uniref:asparaginase n=1 Tax=Streptomyces aureocirculatus TaxID=67275 RepID=UPI00099C2C9E|nr:asparaginase [Streptomyces aureocirculatus]